MECYVTTFRAMGCQVNIWLETDRAGALMLQQVPDWIETIEAVLSRFRATSELSRLNQHVNEWTSVNDVLLENLLEAQRATNATQGLVTPLVLSALVAAGYDRSFEAVQELVSPKAFAPATVWDMVRIDQETGRVWIPDPIDLGGTAKGWTAQRVADRLAVYGPCLVDMGGDIVSRGKPWHIHIHDPYNPDTPLGIVILEDAAIATSGVDYRQWGNGQHHIIDPRTGKPAATDLISATVIHEDAVLAEAWAKAVLIQGSDEGLPWLTQQMQAACLVFAGDGRVLATENFNLTIQQGA